VALNLTILQKERLTVFVEELYRAVVVAYTSSRIMKILGIQKPSHRRDEMNAVSSIQRGFTLIELLIVVAIIGIIAAIAIPGLIGAINQARQKRSMADMATVATAVEAYYVDYAFFPIVNDGVAGDLGEYVSPQYIKIVPENDGWGREFGYSADTGESYSLVSLGFNGTPDLPYINGPTRRFVDDIVHSEGRFIQWPEGAQN
jgi:type II secretion system protein G